MKTQLLIIKSGRDYIRVKDNRFIRCSLDKASVFPMDQVDHVKSLAARLKQSEYIDVCIRKLVLTEEDFQ